MPEYDWNEIMSALVGYEQHGIGRWSVSSMNMAAAQFSFWFAERVLGHKTQMGCAAHRGTSSETGVAHGLMNPDVDVSVCQEMAILQYDQLTAFSGDPKRAKEREVVPLIVANALAELRNYGIPTSLQGKVAHEFDDLPPMLGFWDFKWDQHNIVIDLKTTLRLPSEISEPHQRQVAAYIHGTNASARVCYATPQKVGVYELEGANQHMDALISIAHRVGRFLAISKDPQELAALLIPDYSHWAWSSPAARAIGKSVYGF